MAAGQKHACAIEGSGEVTCWGWDNYGQVSDRPASTPFVRLAAGWYHTCGITTSGDLECWGRDDIGQSTPP